MSTRPNWLFLCVWSSVVACSDVGSRLPVRVPPTQEPAATPSTPNQYYLRLPWPGQQGRVELGDGRIGFVTRGERWILDARGAVVARVHSDAFVVSVTHVAAEEGTSFLFSTRDGLYASETFDGPLQRLLGEQALYVAGGPGFAFVRTSDGRTITQSFANGTRPSFPLGTQSVGASKSGAIGAVVDGGLSFLSTDKGAHFSDVSKAVGEASDVVVRGGKLYFIKPSKGETL